MSDGWDDRPQTTFLELEYRACVRVTACLCRGCGRLCVDPEKGREALLRNRFEPGPLSLPRALPEGAIWAEATHCFSHPRLGFFCPACAGGIGSQLGALMRAKDGET